MEGQEIGETWAEGRAFAVGDCNYGFLANGFGPRYPALGLLREAMRKDGILVPPWLPYLEAKPVCRNFPRVSDLIRESGGIGTWNATFAKKIRGFAADLPAPGAQAALAVRRIGSCRRCPRRVAEVDFTVVCPLWGLTTESRNFKSTGFVCDLACQGAYLTHHRGYILQDPRALRVSRARSPSRGRSRPRTPARTCGPWSAASPRTERPLPVGLSL